MAKILSLIFKTCLAVSFCCISVTALPVDNDATLVPEVSYDYLTNLINQNRGNIIDVREPSEYATLGFIPTSVNIPLGDIESAFSLSPKELSVRYGLHINNFDDEIILYCHSGRRSTIASKTARKLGYTNVKNYKGSMIEWDKKSGSGKKKNLV